MSSPSCYAFCLAGNSIVGGGGHVRFTQNLGSERSVLTCLYGELCGRKLGINWAESGVLYAVDFTRGESHFCSYLPKRLKEPYAVILIRNLRGDDVPVVLLLNLKLPGTRRRYV